MMGDSPRGRAVSAAAVLLLLAPLAFALGGAAFDPGEVANTAGDKAAYSLEHATQFRLNLENVTPYACPVNCTIVESSDVHISITGAQRLTGSFSEAYKIAVTGPASYQSNFTTIAVVLTGNASDVVLQPDASAERTSSQAYTKDLNGSSTMNLTLLPSNRTGHVTLNVIGYVADGNRSSHNGTEVYAIASLPIEMRAQRLIPLNATIVNRANVSVTSVNVSFFARGPNDADYKPVANSTIAALGSHGQADTGVVWDATWMDTSVYSIKVVIDPLHQHPDAFEEDNVAFFQVNLGPPEVDTHAQLVGTAFFWGTVIVIAAIAVGLWFYNSRYE